MDTEEAGECSREEAAEAGADEACAGGIPLGDRCANPVRGDLRGDPSAPEEAEVEAVSGAEEGGGCECMLPALTAREGEDDLDLALSPTLVVMHSMFDTLIAPARDGGEGVVEAESSEGAAASGCSGCCIAAVPCPASVSALKPDMAVGVACVLLHNATSWEVGLGSISTCEVVSCKAVVMDRPSRNRGSKHTLEYNRSKTVSRRVQARRV